MNDARPKKHYFRMFAFLGLILLLGPTIYAYVSTHTIRYSFGDANIPPKQAAIVFGAGIRNNTTPTPLLARRVEAAVKLYEDKKVEKIIVSGDNRSPDHNEPLVMQRYAESLGVPSEVIERDNLGLNTFDTCIRAANEFGVQSAILNTQDYHLPRAVISCKSVGIDVIGHEAENRRGGYNANYLIRELGATLKATLQILT